MLKSKAWMYLRYLCASILWLVSTMSTGVASVEFDRTLSSETLNQVHFSEVQDIAVSSDNLYLLGKKSFDHIALHRKQLIAHTVFVGKEKVFEKSGASALVILPKQRLLVLNKQDNRWAILDASGQALVAIGHQGEQEGELSEPVDVAYSTQGRLYLLEQDNARVSVFSPDGVFLFSFGNRGDKEENLKSPTHIAVDQWDRSYVLDEVKGGRISIYSDKGVLQKQITAADLKTIFPKKPKLQAMSVAADGVLILADKNSGNIVFWDWEKQKLRERFGSKGEGRGQFKAIRSLSFENESQKLFVLDGGNKKVEVFQTDYHPKPAPLHADLIGVQKSSVLRTVCSVSYVYDKSSILCLNPDQGEAKILDMQGKEKRRLQAQFKHPKRAAFDMHMLVILDENSLKVFNHQGDFLFTIGKRGSKKGQFSDASAIALGGRIYVADTGNHRIEVFTRKGVFFKEIKGKKEESILLNEPVAVAVDEAEQVYVADRATGLIYVFNQQDEVIDILGETDKNNRDYFTAIDDLMLDQHNLLYVLGSTQDNDKLIQVYQNHYPLVRFSPLHIKAKVGVDTRWQGQQILPRTGTKAVDSVLGAADGAVHLLTGLAADTFGIIKRGFFASDDEPWIFNQVFDNDALVTVMDPNEKARHTFLFLRVPKPVAAMRMNGSEQQVYLQWQQPSDDFKGSYRIFAKDASGIEKQVTEVLETDVTLPRSGAEQYRVVSVSVYGKHSKPSIWFIDAFQKGLKLYRQKQYTGALQYFRQALADNPMHQGALEYSGRTYIALKQFRPAAQAFARLAQFPQAKTRAYNLQMQALIQEQAWLQAKLVLDQAMHQNAVNAETYGLCAQTLNALDDTLGAIGCLQKAGQLEPQQARWDMRLAHLYEEIGADDQSMQALQQAEQKAGQDSRLWVAIGQAYEAKQKLDKAAYCYLTAIEKDTENQQAYIRLSGVYIAKNDLDKARQSAIAMAAIPELRGMANYVLGRVALKEGKTGRALSLLQKSVKSDGQRMEVWLALADVHHQMENFADEQRALQKALALNPKQADIYQRLGELCIQQSHMVCAQTTFRQALQQYPTHSSFKLGLAQAYLGQNQSRKAETLIQQVLQNKSNDIDALRLLASALDMQGRVAESIRTLQQAIRLDDSRVDLYLQLARAYMVNHMYDQAEQAAEKAVALAPNQGQPYAVLGDIYLVRQMFDKAIQAFSDAGKIEPDQASYRQKLNLAYLQKKKFEESGGAASGPKLSNLQFKPVFAAAYKQYADKPVGSVMLSNNSGVDFKNIKVSFQIKEYMDFPTTFVVDNLAAGASMEVALKASLNNRVLEIDENTGLQTEVSAEYFLGGSAHTEKLNQPITVYGRNAIVWDQSEMLGAFVTPKDQTLNVFIRQMINQYKPKKGLLNDQLAKAMTLFDVFHAMHMQYIQDPNSPYSKLDKTQVDTVQYPRETLRVNSGDCDDLSVLMAASLENLGIETAILDVPGHLLMMFNTGLAAEQKDLISTQDDLLAIVHGQVWIPVEATLVGASFAEAWVEGAKKYHRYLKEHTLKPVYLHQVWQQVTPVTLPPADFQISAPDEKEVRDLLTREYHILLQKAVDRLIEPYQNMLAFDAGNVDAIMQIGIIYAKNGLYEDAIRSFESILKQNRRNSAALNNIGNAYYLLKNYDKAIAYYQEAATLMPNNADILVNIAMSHYQSGQIQYAAKVFKHAVEVDGGVLKRYSELASLLAN